MITTFYPPYNFGGDGIFAYRLSNELAVQGHQVDVIHCKDAYTLLARKRPTDRFEKSVGFSFTDPYPANRSPFFKIRSS
jgi:hypothetical protein